MDGFVASLKQFGIGRVAAIIGVAAGVAAALAVLMFKVGSPDQSLLYGDLNTKDQQAVMGVLDAAGIKYKSGGDGQSLYVAASKVSQARQLAATKGLPSSGSVVGYELLDQQSVLGQTDAMQAMNQKRATEGELTKTIRQWDGITDAKVMLNIPPPAIFGDEPDTPTASVNLASSNGKVSPLMVRAAQVLVAGSVGRGLKPEAVVVVQNGVTLAGGEGDAGGSAMADEARSRTEEALIRKIKANIEPIVGAGKVKVAVTADVDTTRVTTQSEEYDPDKQVVVSTETTEEGAEEAGDAAVQPVTAGGNVPTGTDVAAAGGAAGGSTSRATRELVNYQNSKTVRTEVIEPGAIKKLSVSVAVDGTTAPPGKDGKPGAWAPRSAADMQKIEAYVRAAVGFNAERGDVVTVTNIQFDRNGLDDMGAGAKKSLLSGFGKSDMMRGVDLGVFTLVAVLVIFFVVRPFLKTMGGGQGGMAPMPMLAGAAPGAGGAGAGALAGPTGPMSAQLSFDPQTGQPLAAPASDAAIDIARIEGQVKVSAVKQVSDFVDRHPDESVSILRSWLHETA